MKLDGILTGARRKRPRRNRRQRTEHWHTVSARAREKKADRRRWLGLFILLLVVLAGFGWVAHAGLSILGRRAFSENDKYLVRHWDLESDGPLLTSAHIREYAQLPGHVNLFALNLREVRNRLESVPVVRSVAVSRRLPDTLVIRVAERLAVARLGVDERITLTVDRDGHVLGPGSMRPNLPAIVGLRQPGVRPGMTISDPAFTDALRVLELCERPQVRPYVRIRSIQVADPDNLEIRLANGEQVRMARVHIEQRLVELVGIIQADRASGRIAQTINMTGDIGIPPVVQY